MYSTPPQHWGRSGRARWGRSCTPSTPVTALYLPRIRNSQNWDQSCTHAHEMGRWIGVTTARRRMTCPSHHHTWLWRQLSSAQLSLLGGGDMSPLIHLRLPASRRVCVSASAVAIAATGVCPLCHLPLPSSLSPSPIPPSPHPARPNNQTQPPCRAPSPPGIRSGTYLPPTTPSPSTTG